MGCWQQVTLVTRFTNRYRKSQETPHVLREAQPVQETRAKATQRVGRKVEDVDVRSIQEEALDLVDMSLRRHGAAWLFSMK